MSVYVDGGGRNGGGNNGGGRGGGGGGGIGTMTGSTIIGLPANENGGLIPTTWVLLVPVQNLITGQSYVGFYDSTNFNDPNDGSSYSYRQEDIEEMRVPTVHRIGISYLDLGAALITVTVTASNDNQQVVTDSTQLQIGNVVPTKQIMHKFAYLSVTGFGPQASISVAAGNGPVDIVSLTMYGEIEETEL